MSELFYLQDSRSYVGNDMLFWGKKNRGYTTNLDKAEVYTKESAVAQNRRRDTDIPWPKEYVDSVARPAVDMQYAHINDALENTDIKLAKPEKIRKETYRCYHCGIFLNKYDYYSASGCKKCGGSNLP